jgi:hypothetical protein
VAAVVEIVVEDGNPNALCAATIHRRVDRKVSGWNRIIRIEHASPAIADERQQEDHQAQ